MKDNIKSLRSGTPQAYSRKSGQTFSNSNYSGKIRVEEKVEKKVGGDNEAAKMNKKYQLLPPLSHDENSSLKADIGKRGVMVPVEIDEDGNILDGNHRVRICEELGIDYPVIVREGMTEEEKIKHGLSLNLNRRHLNREQRMELEIKLRKKGWSFRKISNSIGVSHTTVRRDTSDVTNVTPERIDGVDGKSYPAEQKTPKPIPVLFGDDKKAIKEKAKEINNENRKHNRHEKIDKILETTKNNKPLDGIGRFPVILADPPWQYDYSFSDSRRIENQYPTMSIEKICALNVEDIITDDAILFLWVPTPMLKKGLRVLEAWGFDYRTAMVWVKPSIGPGQWVRQRHEHLLIGVKGKIPTPEGSNRPDSVIEAPRHEHSKKPDIVYEIIEEMYPKLPKVELFSRQSRDGWVVWGNEV